jgi:hypothetical protein
MNTRRILAFTFGIAMCSAVSAEDTLSPARLAVVDALVSVCRETAPAGDGAYRAWKLSLIGSPTDRALDALENTAEFQQSYALIRAVLDGTSRDFMRQSCYAAIGIDGGAGNHR